MFGFKWIVTYYNITFLLGNSVFGDFSYSTTLMPKYRSRNDDVVGKISHLLPIYLLPVDA